MRRILRLLAVLVCALTLVLATAAVIFCQASLHVPRRVTPMPATGAWRTVTIQARDRAVLDAWFAIPAMKTSRCVIVLHGIADSKSGSAGFAPMFLGQGYSVLMPDSRAHGESGGEMVTYGLLEKYDVIEWTHWMRQEGCERIYGLGESLGASILIEAAAIEPAFHAAVAECPYSDLPSIAEYRVARMSGLPRLSKLIVHSSMVYARARYGLNLGDISPLRAMAHFETPLLLIHGQRDVLTPPSHSEVLARANPRAVLWRVPNAGHVAASATEPVEFRERVLGWFSEH